MTSTREALPDDRTQSGSMLKDVILGLLVGAVWIAVDAAFELAGCAHNGFGLLTTIVGLLLIPAALIDLFVTGIRGPRFRSRVCLVGFPLVAVLYFGQYVTYAARDIVLARTLQSANLIATAVEAFAREHHRWPKTLDELVPSTLPAIPSTGLRWAPKFDYAASEVAPDDPGYWELSFDYPIGPFRVDQYNYDPAHDGLPASLVPGS
ncbi:MAG: hypothetical protein NTV21_14670 [Planctomycetota bacterium]|nr:hypothetical protein [Planctomycetota bacterium]